MELSAASFITFYEFFWLKILEKEFKGHKLGGTKTSFSPTLWDWPIDGHKERMLQLVKGKTNGKNVLYYHRIYRKCKLTNTPVLVDDLAFCKALKYLGYQTTLDGYRSDVDIKSFNVEITNALYEDFKKEHLNNQITINDGVSVPAMIQDIPDGEETAEQMIKARDILGAKSVIIQYFQHLNSGLHRKAWDLMTPNLQEREWKNPDTGEADFKKFAMLYRNTRAVTDIHIFQLKQIAAGAMAAIVYYIDVVTVYKAFELDHLKSLRIGQLNDFVKRVKAFKKRSPEPASGKLEDIEIFRLFNPGLSEHLRYKMAMSETDLKKLSSEPDDIRTQRLCYITCHLVAGQWLIHMITETKAWPAR